MKLKLFLLFLVFIWCSIFNYGAIPASERAILIELYNSTGGEKWSNQAGWKTEPLHTDGFAVPGTEDDWYGIAVSGDRVTAIILSGNQLIGSIPANLGSLSNLEGLYLSSNQLKGKIPTQLGSLKKLQQLQLMNNQLSGTIPSELGNLGNLKVLLLSKNQFSGSIPSQLGKLTNLIGFYVTNNKLTGSIPSQLGSLTKLKSIDLSNNQFSGTIPVEFGNCKSITVFKITGNKLTGSIPSQFGNLTSMTILFLYKNQLTGSIPSQIGNLANLVYLCLNNNELTGEIPTSFKNLKNVSGLDLGYNCLKATDSKLRAWLQKKDPDWEEHQDQCPPAPVYSITLNRTQLFYGASTAGLVTLPQAIVIDKTGNGTSSWTASSNSTWLTVTPGSGTDAGIITVSVNVTGLSEGTYNGTVKVADPGATNSPQSVSVKLQVYNQENTAEPFGDFATPVDGSSTYNSVPVTGWVLDDIGVSSVKIYYNESPIGEAVFVEGARPDVQAAFPGYPNNHKAGWGYMLLTQFLPGGGNGTYTLVAKAADFEGNEVTLGSKTFNIDNANAVKPFGNIDTPTQGGTASGAKYVDWGWALTPKPNSIPIDGSTISVYVDGVNKGHPKYNILRSDIATLFPGYANSNGAVGYAYVDTTALKNGLHTIAWNVADNAGNTEGIGSRYFFVMNTSSSSSSASANTASSHQPFSLSTTTAYPELNPISSDDKIQTDSMPVWVHYGYNENEHRTPNLVEPDKNGIYILQSKELERIQVYLRGIGEDVSRLSGFMRVGDQFKPLPIGSTLDSKQGVFYWQPGPGFVGDYHLVFVAQDDYGWTAKKDIVVRIGPKH